jgi:DNA-binding XRE family transcriptional regulator
MEKGRKPNYERRRQARKLREQGLSRAEIGKIMGVGSKAVTLMLAKSGGPVKAWVRCCQCGVEITQVLVRITNGSAHCLKCLKKEKKPPFGTRLRAYRVVKGLTPAELSREIGVRPSLINALENGSCHPSWNTLLALVEVLGQELVSEPPM